MHYHWSLNRYSFIAAILQMTACETVGAIKFRKPAAVLNVNSQRFTMGYTKDQFDTA
jgi:hypothetical protein